MNSKNASSKKSSARAAAVGMISAVLDQHKSLSEASDAVSGLEARDQAFAKRLTYGVLRWKGALDWLVSGLLDRPMKNRDQDVYRLILLGVYQLWKEDTPGHAAVHATAESAKQLNRKWAVGLVNAVLRRFQREQVALLAELEKQDARFSHPQWLFSMLADDWPDDHQDIMKANNEQAPLWVRCNGARTDVATQASDIEAAGFQVRTHTAASCAMMIVPAKPLDQIPGFKEGLWSVQDAAAQLAAPLLQIEQGHRILDACAAPGGKTCHLLEMGKSIALTALDADPERIELVRENLDRLSLDALLVQADASDPDSWWDGEPYDRILLDAPCSATGVIRRHPEIKWLRDPEQVEMVTGLQARLLDQLWPLLKSGGILVYATCSVLDRENSQQIQMFLDRQSDAGCIGPDGIPGRARPFGCQILPGEQQMDGFYYAVLHKSA